MSNYNGRKGPNMSQYLRDLNTISPQDSTGSDAPIDIQDDLSFFANTQFYDLDSGQNTDFQAPPVKPNAAGSQNVPTPEDPSAVMGEMSSIDFMNGDFNFSDLNAYQGSSSMNSFTDAHQGFQALQPNHGSMYSSQGHSAQQFPHPAGAVGPKGASGDKKKAIESTVSTPSRPMGNQEEAARMTAEEDKRRRNTAASARFRIKKKQREQALEKSAKEMTDKVSSLESRVSQLETENKWLKNLLVEKNEGNEDITALWKEFTQNATRRGGKALAANEKR